MTLALAALLSLAACGGGGDGNGMQPPAEATITGPIFTSGANERQSVNIGLQNTRPVAALQVDLVSPPEVIPMIDGISVDGRASGSFNVVVQNLARGRARILLFDPAGQRTIPTGDGSVLILNLRVGENATAGTSVLGLERASVVDLDAEEFDVTLVPGQVTVR
jgi:Cohesin domain